MQKTASLDHNESNRKHKLLKLIIEGKIVGSKGEICKLFSQTAVNE